MVRGTLLAVKEQPIIGRPADVRNALIAAQQRGVFVSCTPPRLLADGRVAVTARLLDSTPPRPRRVRPVVIVAALAAVAVLGLVAWLVVTTVTAAGRWVGDNAPAVAIGATLLALLLAGVGRRCEITVIHRRH